MGEPHNKPKLVEACEQHLDVRDEVAVGVRALQVREEQRSVVCFSWFDKDLRQQ